jgi:exonuclease VII small subunit
VYLRRDKLDEAEASFKHAVALHKQAQDVLGEAYDVQKLEDVYLRRKTP